MCLTRQVSGKSGLDTSERRGGAETGNSPKQGHKVVSDVPGHATGELQGDLGSISMMSDALQNTDIARHPGALHFQVSAANPSQLAGEIWLRFEDLDNVGCGRSACVHRQGAPLAFRVAKCCPCIVLAGKVHGQSNPPFQMPAKNQLRLWRRRHTYQSRAHIRRRCPS